MAIDKNYHIFISRNLSKNSFLKKELHTAGFKIIDQSLIDFSPIPFNEIPSVDWIFFYSKNGVKFFFEQLSKPLAKNIKWAVMGKGTEEALAQQKITANFVGTGHPKATAKQFLNLAKGQKILFPRAKNSKKSIQKLIAKEIIVEDLVIYENTLKNKFSIPPCQYLVFTSPLNAIAYFQKYAWQPEQKVIAIGKTTATALKELSIMNIIIAGRTSEIGLVEAVLRAHKE